MQPVELGYVAAGQGPTVVALHGGLLSGRLTYGPVLADWAQRLRVLVPDRRGFERTPGVSGTTAAQARDLEAFIQAATRPVADRMRALGYAYRDDPGSDNHDGHMFLLHRADGHRLVHAHVVVHGARWWRDRIAFRDLLRADPRLRASYRTLKQRLARDHADDREAYTDAKTTFVSDALARAARSHGDTAS